jgi:hypothetical protein
VTQATLRTNRITLVPLSDEHLDLEVELDSDPEVMRYLTGRGRTRDEVTATHRLRLAGACTARTIDHHGRHVAHVQTLADLVLVVFRRPEPRGVVGPLQLGQGGQIGPGRLSQ